MYQMSSIVMAPCLLSFLRFPDVPEMEEERKCFALFFNSGTYPIMYKMSSIVMAPCLLSFLRFPDVPEDLWHPVNVYIT